MGPGLSACGVVVPEPTGVTASGQGSGGHSSTWLGVQSAGISYVLYIWGASEAWQAQHTSNESAGLFQASLGHPCYPEGCSDV